MAKRPHRDNDETMVCYLQRAGRDACVGLQAEGDAKSVYANGLCEKDDYGSVYESPVRPLPHSGKPVEAATLFFPLAGLCAGYRNALQTASFQPSPEENSFELLPESV